jgi:Zn/Cd-binding protein ZinT
MDFLKVVDEVKTQLSSFSVKQKAELFKEVLNYPISVKNGVFYVSGTAYDDVRLSDYLQIREHWMSMQELDTLHRYFGNTEIKR